MHVLKQLLWIEELLPPEVEQKSVPGGIAYYLNEKKILMLTESNKTTDYRGKKYPFELWNGCFFPIERIKQSTVCAKFPFLENHPANKNALYLPAETEEFETLVRAVLREINKRNPLFGSVIKESTADQKARLQKANHEDIVDMSRPSLFNTDARVIKKKKTTQKSSSKKPVKKVKANKKSENALMLTILKRQIK